MTTDGNFNVNNINTINMPQILKSINAAFMGSTNLFSIYGNFPFYYNSTDLYTFNQSNGLYKAPITEMQNGILLNASQPDGQTRFFATLYPTPIGSYYYNFSTIDDLGGAQGGNLYRAPIDNPSSWIDLGITTPSNATNPMIYYDNSNVYVIGGRNATTIDSGATPTTLAASLNVLPAARCTAPLVTVGSTIYMYGGFDGAGTEVNTIYSASTADPTTWTDLGALMPVAIAGSAAYNDGTYVWLFGGSVGGINVNTIYQATVGAPTTFVAVGTLPVAEKNMGFLVVGTNAYLIGTDAYSTVFRAALSDLTTWTALSSSFEALPTAVRSSIVFTLNNTIYALGGITTGTTKITTIQTASTSTPLEWTTSGTVLPTGLAAGQLIKTKNYLYLLGADGVTGNYYKAPIATPEVFTLVDATGPTVPYGKALVYNGQVFYLGGESAPGTAVTTVLRGTFDTSTVPTGDLVGWKGGGPPYFVMALPIALSRFSLIVAGNYAYILGGYTTAGAMNFSIYRLNLDSINTGWINVGSLVHPMVSSNTILINNTAYIVCGGPSSTFTTTDDYIASASMTELANGYANFTEANTASGYAFAEAGVAVANNNIYFIGGRGATDGVRYVLRTFYSSPHTLIAPRVPEATHSIPTVDLKSGALGSYSSFQRTGILPWLIYDK